jgi:hypothetical protein
MLRPSQKSLIQRVWTAYANQIRRENPIKAKMVTAFVLFCAGDITCQKGIEGVEKWDPKRTLIQGFIGGFMMNPVSQVFYIHISHRIGPPVMLGRMSRRIFGYKRNGMNQKVNQNSALGMKSGINNVNSGANNVNFNTKIGQLTFDAKRCYAQLAFTQVFNIPIMCFMTGYLRSYIPENDGLTDPEVKVKTGDGTKITDPELKVKTGDGTKTGGGDSEAAKTKPTDSPGTTIAPSIALPAAPAKNPSANPVDGVVKTPSINTLRADNKTQQERIDAGIDNFNRTSFRQFKLVFCLNPVLYFVALQFPYHWRQVVVDVGAYLYAIGISFVQAT